LEVLLITSRDTGRWVIPKGWPMRGRTDGQAAEREAFEEAGVTGRISAEPLGKFTYEKRLPDRVEICEVTVFRLDVDRQRKAWPEQRERQCRWYALEEAAEQVGEAGLKELIARLLPGSAARTD